MQSTPIALAKAVGRTAIPKAIREQTWVQYNGNAFLAKCHVAWCENTISPFTFEVGHNIPFSLGGETNISNLRPICSGCNKSMGNKYTIDEFSKLSDKVPRKLPHPNKTKRTSLLCCLHSSSVMQEKN